jgi:hypothetical protein
VHSYILRLCLCLVRRRRHGSDQAGARRHGTRATGEPTDDESSAAAFAAVQLLYSGCCHVYSFLKQKRSTKLFTRNYSCNTGTKLRTAWLAGSWQHCTVLHGSLELLRPRAESDLARPSRVERPRSSRTRCPRVARASHRARPRGTTNPRTTSEDHGARGRK